MLAVQSYVASLSQPADQQLLLMVENDQLVAKSRADLTGLSAFWTYLQAKLFGCGPLSFRKVCTYINEHPEQFKFSDAETPKVEAWEKFKSKVQTYNTGRTFWKSVSPLTPQPIKINYDLIAVIEKVQLLSMTQHTGGKKLGLFIGRTPEEEIPKEDDTLWVSLDLAHLKDNVPASRIHLNLDYNSDKAKDLFYLFDKVVGDPCTLGGRDPWRRLVDLLRPGSDSILFMESLSNYCGIATNALEAEEQPLAFRGICVKPVNDLNNVRYRQTAIEKAMAYLQTFFESVDHVGNHIYKYDAQGDYFLIQGPKSKQ